MKYPENGNLRGWAATGLLAGAVALVAGCVEHHVEYVPAVRREAVYQGPGPSAPPPPIQEPAPPPSAEVAAAPMPVAPPAPAVVLRSSAELDQMLGTIALYPDPLIAQILPAATLPEQVVMADRYVRGGGDPAQIDAQTWDMSVKAVARYPSVLQMMDDNLAWTTDLGQAFLNQPTDVMDAVQRLRAQAQALGNLQSTPQQTVVMDQGAIEIVPASPEVIYVPVYQPEVVFVQRPLVPGRLWISFGMGFSIGGWLNHDCDWHHHDLIVWHHDSPRPRNWWYRPAERAPRSVVVNNVTVVNNRPAEKEHFTVWRPKARPGVSGPDRGDRGWGAHDARPAPAAKEIRPSSAPKEVRPVQAPKDMRPAIVAKDAHPTPAPRAAQPPVAAREGRPALPTTEAHPTPPPSGARPVVTVPKDKHPAVAAKDARPAPAPKAAQPPPAVKEARPPAPPKEVRPAPAPQPAQAATARPAAPPVAPPKEARPAPAPRPAAQVASPQPTVRAAAPPAVRSEPVAPRPSPALVGIENAHATRESSSRGQQSRETMSRPSAPAHSSAPAPSAPSRGGGDSKKH